MPGTPTEAGVPIDFPDKTEPQNIIAVDANTVGIAIKLAEEDKLSDDKSLAVSSFISFDDGKTWEFVNGMTWQSLEKGYPDPQLSLPVSAKRGGIVKAVVESSHATTIDAEFSSR